MAKHTDIPLPLDFTNNGSIPGMVDGTGTVRRLRALAALGWPLPFLAAKVSEDPQALLDGLRHYLPVQRSTAYAVVDLFHTYSTRVPREEDGVEQVDAVRARRDAFRECWPTPAAWEGLDIDDPSPFHNPPKPDPSRDGTGTIRRLQALATLGWSTDLLESELGCIHGDLDAALAGRPVTSVTQLLVADGFERLWNTPPTAYTSRGRRMIELTKAHADESGWLAPLAWDHRIDDPTYRPPRANRRKSTDEEVDPHAVERSVQCAVRNVGNQPSLNDAEKVQVMLQLLARGWSISAIAEHVHMRVARARVLLDEYEAANSEPELDEVELMQVAADYLAARGHAYAAGMSDLHGKIGVE